jgi:selenide,water dikinase
MSPSEFAKLTEHARSGGCAAKLNPVDLRALTEGFAAQAADPDLLVGIETGDDAGVYRVAPDLAIVQTVDYITPVVDDPFLFGQVAATNAISDIYAMGGRPITGLNCCMFPAKGIDAASLRRILEGGWSKMREAGIALLGGHTVRDDELKYGLAVTGVIDPRRILTNVGARPGDVLALTKPLGTGVIVIGRRRGVVDDALLERALGAMTTLNKAACEAMLEAGATACTDVTGFGFATHALGMTRRGGVRFRVRFDDLPRFDESLALIRDGLTTSVTGANRAVSERDTAWSGTFRAEEQELVFDPQTSGGLLVALPDAGARGFLERLRAGGGATAALVGEVLPAGGGPALEFVRASRPDPRRR